MRFNRDYELILTLKTEQIMIQPPFRVAFNATKSIYGGLNKMTIQIYGLGKEKRLQLVKDAEDWENNVPLQLSIGYQNSLGLLFKGNLHIGTLSKQGVEYINKLECLDGGNAFFNSFSAKNVKGKKQAITSLTGDLKGVSKGQISTFNETMRPHILVGKTYDLLQEQMTDNETVYIDNEVVNILKQDEILKGFIPVISAETGLLNTPQRKNKRVSFETMLNPSLKLGGKAQLESVTAPFLNGIYKIEQMIYTGDNYGADWKQNVTGTLI